MSNKQLYLPLKSTDIQTLTVGSIVCLNGVVYTARDQAHKRIAQAIELGEELPFPIDGAAVYYCGPTPAPKDRPIGSCGPTTSGRMDKFTPLLIKHGLKVMIGKGVRNEQVTQAIKDNGAVYLSAIGGAAALYQSRIKSCELIAYPELGCEAVYKLEVENFPVIVTIK